MASIDPNRFDENGVLIKKSEKALRAKVRKTILDPDPDLNQISSLNGETVLETRKFSALISDEELKKIQSGVEDPKTDLRKTQAEALSDAETLKSEKKKATADDKKSDEK